MESTMDKANQFDNKSKLDVGKTFKPNRLLRDTKRDRNTASDSIVAVMIEEIPTLELRAVDIDQLVTRVGMKIEYPISFSGSFLVHDSISIHSQPTWRLPAIQGSGSVSVQARRSVKQIQEGESYLELIRNLVKSSGIYAISSLASPLVTLVLAPFLTHSLSKTDYGALVVLNSVISLVALITQFGLSSAIIRAYNYDYETRQDRLRVLSTAVVLISLTSISLAVAIAMSAPWVASFVLGNASFGDAIQIASLVVFVQNLSVPGFAWLRAENRAKVFSALAMINLLISLCANVVLVGVAHMGIDGSLLATGAGYAAVVICMLPPILLRAGFALRQDIARNLLSFGIPLVFNSVSFWMLQFSDRYLLSRLGSLAQTASYGVAYNLGGALNVVILAPFILAWPVAMFTIAKREDAPYVFQQVFRWFCMVLLLAAFVLALIALAVLDLFFPPSYHSAAPIIPIIAVSTMFFGVYNIFAVGIGVRRKTWVAACIMTLAALVNIGCNFVLIPLYGSMGAALSTLIACVFIALIMYIVNQRIYPVPFEIHIFAIALLVGLAVYVGSSFLAQHQTKYEAYAIYIGATVFYGGCLLLFGKLPARNNKRAQRHI
jgi:O-antigen/teichoic acid export membrane protein